MPALRVILRPGETSRSVIAVLLLAQWTLLLAFASSERLHHAVCDGAKQPTHDCAFVSVAKGNISIQFDPITVPPRSLLVAAGPGVDGGAFLSVADLRLMPERGPPAGLLLL